MCIRDRSLTKVNIAISQGLSAAKRIIPIVDIKNEIEKNEAREDIKINDLKKYDVNFQKILFLSWLENKKCNLPNSAVLEEIINKFIHSEKTSCPKHIWGSKNKGNEVCLIIKKGMMSVEAS